MLAKFSAEVRAYAVALIALILMLLVPMYGAVRRRLDGERLLRAVTAFFAANLLLFWAAAVAGMSIAFPFFIWVSIFGVVVIAQLWAFAADSFNLKSGQRLFPVIMVGANLGALQAPSPPIAGRRATPVGLMLVATLILLSTIRSPVRTPRRAGRFAPVVAARRAGARLLGGSGRLRDNLLLIAPLVVLLNWTNTTGELISRTSCRGRDRPCCRGGGALDKAR
jgi:AAA family ATP:ADP antiporter